MVAAALYAGMTTVTRSDLLCTLLTGEKERPKDYSSAAPSLRFRQGGGEPDPVLGGGNNQSVTLTQMYSLGAAWQSYRIWAEYYHFKGG